MKKKIRLISAFILTGNRVDRSGVNVRTSWPDEGYRSLTGNSFACPHIAGIIALSLDAYPNLTPFQVKSALYAIAKENLEKKAEDDNKIL